MLPKHLDNPIHNFEIQISGDDYTYFSKNCHIEGDVVVPGALVIHGNIEGNVKTGSDLLIGEGAVITGDIYAKNLVIQGKVFGNLFIDNVLIVKERTVISGEINAANFICEKNIQLKGLISIGKNNEYTSDPQIKAAKEEKLRIKNLLSDRLKNKPDKITNSTKELISETVSIKTEKTEKDKVSIHGNGSNGNGHKLNGNGNSEAILKEILNDNKYPKNGNGNGHKPNGNNLNNKDNGSTEKDNLTDFWS